MSGKEEKGTEKYASSSQARRQAGGQMRQVELRPTKCALGYKIKIPVQSPVISSIFPLVLLTPILWTRFFWGGLRLDLRFRSK